MHITTIASGSGGNCTVVSFNGTHILIDMGISLRRLRLGLERLGLCPSDLFAVLVSHEHGDHVSGLPALAKNYGIPILAPPATAESLRRDFPLVYDYTGSFRFAEDFKLGGISVRAFKTPHDTPDSAGFRLWADGASFGFCTDLGHVSAEVLDNLCGAKGAILESNHDINMLRRGPYPAFLKRRILSDYGHLSNDSVARLAVHLAESGTSSVVLAHLSEENNTPALALGTVSAALRQAGFGDVTLKTAPPDGMIEITL